MLYELGASALRDALGAPDERKLFMRTIKVYGKRKQQVLEGKKLPESFRKPYINFGHLIDDALCYSKRNKRS